MYPGVGHVSLVQLRNYLKENRTQLLLLHSGTSLSAKGDARCAPQWPNVVEWQLKNMSLLSGGHHELRGAAGGAGAGDNEGAVQGHQSGHAVRMHRRDRGATGRRNLPVFAVSRPLWETGRAALQGESGE